MDGITVGFISLFVTIVLGVFGLYWTLRKDIRKEYTEEGERREAIKSFMEGTKGQLVNLNKRFLRLEERFSYFSNRISAELGITLFIESKSPIVLTESGEELAEEVSAQEWVDRVSGTLKEEVKDLDAYGIQDFCFEYVDREENQYNPEEEKVIRDSAFKRGISTYYIRQVLAIKLRDKLLKEAGLEAP